MKKFLLYIALMVFSSSILLGQDVGLVLSGGGAKGLSHIGVIQALEENQIPIDYVGGTSMGAIIGGLYSIGISPSEMVKLFKSDEFNSWYKGMPEHAYANYFYRDAPTPKMVSFTFSKKVKDSKDPNSKKNWNIDLPTSLVSPYPMDLAVMQIFASSCVASKFNFDSLMVPFFCVAADISNKKSLVLKRGDLGAAIRASMTFPLYFKPITIDSTLLFDGGFYNNFPWDIMEESNNPDYIIGAKCVEGESELDENDVMSQVVYMLTTTTDYKIPEDKGVVIEGEYGRNLMDFTNIDAIVKDGYDNAIKEMESIKASVKRRITQDELEARRLSFRSKCGEVRFSDSITITGDINDKAKEFISKTIRDDQESEIDFATAKRGYYRVIASKNVKTFYPSYSVKNDSLLNLSIRASKSSPFVIDLGGNISSSSLNQGYLGITYRYLTNNPWSISSDFNLGKYYYSAGAKFRHDISVHPLAFYDLEVLYHQFDYYNGNQKLFSPDKVPNNVQNGQLFFRGGVATPLNIRKNILARFNLVVGEDYYRYYQVKNFGVYDKPDRSNIRYIAPSLSLLRNTQDYLLYPTMGKSEMLSFKFINAREKFNPGTTSLNSPSVEGRIHNNLRFRLKMDSYVNIGKVFSLGWLVDVSLSGRAKLENYISTMLYTPAFEPIPHSKTLMLPNYRANNFIGLGISPVVKFSPTIYLHTTMSYFQPYQQLVELGDGGYDYTNGFNDGGIIANAAMVWQSPIGPISISTSYYDRPERDNWYTQFNIGLLIFKRKSLDN